MDISQKLQSSNCPIYGIVGINGLKQFLHRDASSQIDTNQYFSLPVVWGASYYVCMHHIISHTVAYIVQSLFVFNKYPVQPLDPPPPTKCLDAGSRPMSSSSSTPRPTWTENTTGCTSSTSPSWSSTLWTSTEVGFAWPPSASVRPRWSSSTSTASLEARMWWLLWEEFPTRDTGPTCRRPCTSSTTSSSRHSQALGSRWGEWFNAFWRFSTFKYSRCDCKICVTKHIVQYLHSTEK